MSISGFVDTIIVSANHRRSSADQSPQVQAASPGCVRLSDARGRPIAFHLTPGEAADCKAYDTLIDLPEQQPKALLADKAYDTDAIRYDLKKHGIKAVIPPKSNRKTVIRYNKRLYRQRNCIERVFGLLEINRAIATRYDQLADSFLGMLFLASARYWLKFVHAA